MNKAILGILSFIFFSSGCSSVTVTPIHSSTDYDTYSIKTGFYNTINDLFKEANKLCGERGYTLLSGPESSEYPMGIVNPKYMTFYTIKIKCKEKKDDIVSN